ncbi:glutaredoxin family protein [Aeromicrobium sp. Sec7.5]|uniref:glutaredoxin family protein n=1 Tax=Aeromicrobium sp. Sec7.5 TaxID=3121276 RepID=UPI002FE439BF
MTSGPSAGASSEVLGSARVVLLVRDGCHLCEVATAVVESVTQETGDTWTTVDVDTDPALAEQWNDEVPVTFVDGRQHDFWRVDPQRLRAALAG